MWKEAAKTASFTSLSYQHEQASHTNKDLEMLVLKNKINSYYCQRLIRALISILILSSQETAAHVSSLQEPTTAAYQYIMHNTVWHTKSTCKLGFFCTLRLLTHTQTFKALNIYFWFCLSSLVLGHLQTMLSYKDAVQIRKYLWSFQQTGKCTVLPIGRKDAQ